MNRIIFSFILLSILLYMSYDDQIRLKKQVPLNITSEDLNLYYGESEIVNVNGQVNEDILKSILEDEIIIKESEIGSSPYTGGYRKDIESNELTVLVVGDEFKNYYRLLRFSTTSSKFNTKKEVAVGNSTDLIAKLYPNVEKYKIENGTLECFKITDGNEFGYSLIFNTESNIIKEIVVEKSDP